MSTFVYGKAHQLVEPAWYLLLAGRKEQDMVSTILRDNCSRFVRDPHRGQVSAISAFASMQVAMEVDFGCSNRMGCYVNKNGGMCPQLAEIIKTVEAETWPDMDRITVDRWPNAKHYYARVDGIDVVWDGQSKWNTYKSAHAAAERFMAERDFIKRRRE